ncbi:type II toxin-antitoxin system VapC family toxin [Methylobacterium sp. J-070]|uniref:type II toxin-antitoxin system VapC family toxin n=1 Tax=Methylobacterium sp. J-070 TaxID=2836650 RepID=UPI001FBBF11F|nr:type II toxin-antitoxin system VapC family toxin [Methylobacterium sp. J-070]MCJ2053922.1 type II toxin-antitoxin system VapC family toxin [Methylobacterium sp. J-070]
MPDQPKIYYWDACMFYEVLSDQNVKAEHRAAVDEILARNKKKENLIITSVVTHIEVLPKKVSATDAEKEAKYLAMFDGTRIIDVELGRNVATLAREIRDFYYKSAEENEGQYKMMDANDAVHLATAYIYKAVEFHTRDNDSKKAKVPLVDLYKYSGISKICNKYELVIVSPETAQGYLGVFQ